MSGDTLQSQGNEIGHRHAPIVLAHEQSFQIGDAEFRPATREVRFATRTSIIEPRVMQVLIALRRAEGAVVNKDDLLQSCWGGRIVGEDAINRVVSRLRGVAENEAGGQFRIETITKVGYRLLSASGEALATAKDRPSRAHAARRRTVFFAQHPMAIAAGLLLLVMSAGTWLWFRPTPAAAHSMMVRLSGFRALSADLPTTMRESINAEITAAFNVDGLIGVSTTTAPTPGPAPAYSLDGTLYPVGHSIRVITRFTNERSGVVLWSDSTDYASDQISKIPHKIAVNVGTVIRCGLSGAATYRKSLPDPVLSNYMQYCQEYWSYGGSRTLHFAQRVVAAVPDFSWGWSAVANGFMQTADAERDGRRAEAMRAAGRQAEDKALALDRSNSEALAHKAYLIDQRDWVGQEALFKSAIAVRPLDCGCEHYGYGLKLESVGRVGAAIEQFRAATDMLALWPDSQRALARALVATGRSEQARPYIEAAIALSKNPNSDKRIAVTDGIETGDYAAAITVLRSPQFQIPEDSRAALLAGYQALASGEPKAKLKAIQGLLALPKDKQSDTVATMLGTLGANRQALQVAARKPWLFWRRSMRGVLNEPDFPAVATQLGLMTYWRTSRTKPDICLTKSKFPFCRMI
ncbi:winged helix-turn-helix domain-containing protein [Sphingobium nicotianae]|nr:winged helix-turn-helix domain-containing protein [Sphingobium nicotianae]